MHILQCFVFDPLTNTITAKEIWIRCEKLSHLNKVYLITVVLVFAASLILGVHATPASKPVTQIRSVLLTVDLRLLASDKSDFAKIETFHN